MSADAPGSANVLPREVRVLVAASFVIAIGYGIVAPALPVFARSFDVGVTAVSLVISAFAVLRTVFAPVSGRLVARLGELRVFGGGLLVVAASSAACGFATEYWQLLVFRSAGGIGSTMFTVAAASLVIGLAPESMRGRAAGAWSTAFLLGTIAGPVVGGVLVAVSLSAPFLAYAGLLVVATVVSGAMLAGRVGDPPVADPLVTGRLTFGALVRHPTFRAALAANFVNGWTVYGVRIALVPLLVVDVLRQPGVWPGVVLASFAAGSAMTLFAGGLVSDRHGRRPPVLIGSLIIAGTALWLGFGGTVTELVGASLLSGIGTGLVSTPVTAAVGDLMAQHAAPADRGPVLAGYQLVGDLGAIIGPLLGGMIAELGGYSAAFALTAAVAMVSFGCWWRAPETMVR